MMSLWKVDDEGTKQLMTRYYSRLFAGGARSDALREVQLEMMAEPKTSHPYYWASFIVSGNPRTLAGKAPTSVHAARVVKASTVPSLTRGSGTCGCDVAGLPTHGIGGLVTSLVIALTLRARRRSRAE